MFQSDRILDKFSKLIVRELMSWYHWRRQICRARHKGRRQVAIDNLLPPITLLAKNHVVLLIHWNVPFCTDTISIIPVPFDIPIIQHEPYTPKAFEFISQSTESS